MGRTTQSTSRKAGVQPPQPGPDSLNRKDNLSDYIVINAFFAAFCIAQLVIIRLILRDFAGLYFFFGFLMISFIIVSAFDYLSQKLPFAPYKQDGVASADER